MHLLPLKIGMRFLLARRRALIMSLTGVTLGVAFFIVAQAQTGGFEGFFIRTILGTNGAIRLQDRFQQLEVRLDAGQRGTARMRPAATYEEGVRHPARLRAALSSFEGLTASASVLRGPAEFSTAFRSMGAQLLGIEPGDFAAVSALESQMIEGKFEDFARDPLAIIVGSRFARDLSVGKGDAISVISGNRSTTFSVAGIFETGVADIDEERAYAHLSEARAALGERFGVSFIQIALADPSTAPAIARRLEAVTGHYAGAWQEREKVWLDVFRALRVSAAISLSSILVIAGVGMFSALAMIVMEKQREIAILRSSGFSRGDVAAVFFWQAMLLLVAGCLLGCAIAAAATWGLSNLPLRVRGIFSTDSFVVAWSPWHYFWAVLAATVAVLPAAVLPARRAARIEPAVILRGSGD